MTRLTKKMTVNTDTREQLLALLQGDQALRALLQTTVHEVLEAEMDEALGATKSERSGERRGYPTTFPCSMATNATARWSASMPPSHGQALDGSGEDLKSDGVVSA